MTPQIIVLVLVVLALGMELAKHGEVKKATKYNFWTTFFAQAVTIALLYWGGFFDALLGG